MHYIVMANRKPCPAAHHNLPVSITHQRLSEPHTHQGRSQDLEKGGAEEDNSSAREARENFVVGHAPFYHVPELVDNHAHRLTTENPCISSIMASDCSTLSDDVETSLF